MRALNDLREGKIVLVFDSDNRERETDMVVASEKVTPGIVRAMRKDGGGLICVTIHDDIRDRIGTPYLADVFNDVSASYPVLSKLIPNDIPYDAKSAFSITINHRKTFTGITDNDRALTITEFAKLAKVSLGQDNGWAKDEFGRQFRAPGHVCLLNARKDLLSSRTGHTELTTALMVMAGVTPSATICEMMGDDGNSLSKEKAQEYARRHDLCYLEGSEVVRAWRDGEWSR
ncbi:MAG: 3,4-dihydroxy-2-butanone-4-phosphate synthase [Methanomassiliicoccales archaeon]